MTAALILALYLHPCLSVLPPEIGALQLTEPGWDSTPPAGLARAFGDAPSGHLLAQDMLEEIASEVQAFAATLDPAAGGGDGAGPIAALAFVLGVIPGFGIGHLVAGSFGGFISWLIVDVVVGVLLFYILPVLLFPAFGYIWTINVVVLVIERVIEGYSAYRTAVATGGVALEESSPPPGGNPAIAPRRATPNLLSLRF